MLLRSLFFPKRIEKLFWRTMIRKFLSGAHRILPKRWRSLITKLRISETLVINLHLVTPLPNPRRTLSINLNRLSILTSRMQNLFRLILFNTIKVSIRTSLLHIPISRVKWLCITIILTINRIVYAISFFQNP